TVDTPPPRRAAAGADVEGVAGLEYRDFELLPHDSMRLFSLAGDVDRLHETLRRWTDCRLIVVDPLSAFLDGIDANNNMDVRRLLLRLSTIAERYDAAVLLVSHFRKASAPSALYRALGSLAFTAAARVVLTLVKDPAVANRRLLLPAKMNLLPEAHGRAFRMHPGRLQWDPDLLYLSGDELHELTVRGLATSDRLSQVAEWLKELLADGRRPSTEITDLARLQQVPVKLLYAAKKPAGIRAVHDGRTGRWFWELTPEKKPWYESLIVPDDWSTIPVKKVEG
ncbi:MAG: helicase RepA family protein, partial [Planctomycetes bacterium]|nr:helicase RepA family protein [Planctomycetota bacterium]